MSADGKGTGPAGETRTRGSLVRQDWIAAGQELMIADGIAGVKLSRLTRRLGVTSGSFYHHFGDFPAYLGQLADHYASDNVDQVLAAVRGIGEPASRIRTLSALAEDWDAARLDSAMRVWATSNERARVAVQRFDEQFLELLQVAFAQLGFSSTEARLRARFALAAGVGQQFLFGHPARPGDAADALDLLLDLSTGGG